MKNLPLERVNKAVFEDMVDAENALTNLVEFFNDCELDGFAFDYQNFLDDVKRTRNVFQKYYQERWVI